MQQEFIGVALLGDCCDCKQGFCWCIRSKSKRRTTLFDLAEKNAELRRRLMTISSRGYDHDRMAKNAPVTDTSNTGNAMYMNSWVAEVAIAHPNGDLIKKYNLQQKRLEMVQSSLLLQQRLCAAGIDC